MENRKDRDIKMKNVAILYICTGLYVEFWQDFFLSFEKKFLPDSRKEYYVFTDAVSLYGECDCHRIHKIYQENLGWPENTLFRFGFFRAIEKELAGYDYIFFMNANIICHEEVTEKEFLPLDENIVVVQHPGYYNERPYIYAYERRKKSLAYIPYWKGQVYVCGGVNGGKAGPFLKLIRELDEKIKEDYENGMIATWHDESHLNKYILDRKDYKLLSPSYCYPEGWDLPFEVKFLVLDKEKKIKLDRVKIQGQKRKASIMEKVKKKSTLLFWSLIYRFSKLGNERRYL